MGHTDWRDGSMKYATFTTLTKDGVLVSVTHHSIFNASICQGVVPGRWKEATILPVPKSHPPRSNQSDVRPISLSATLGKILDSFIGEWILECIGETSEDQQYGTLKQRSTVWWTCCTIGTLQLSVVSLSASSS